ncbi:MAG: MMPL family transporter [Lentisphaeria bacterium]|nr:MMPL family transporter [Lentisphaeria bacterium]
MSKQRRVAEWVLRHRPGVVAAVLVVTGFLGWQLRDPTVLYESYDSEEHQGHEGEAYKQFARTFQQGELLLCVVKAADVFRPEILTYLRHRTEAVKALPLVTRVDSLTTVEEIVRTPQGNILARLLFPDVPSDAAEIERRKQAALSHPLWVGNLLSRDATTTVLNVVLPPLVRGSREAKACVDELRALLEVGRPAGVEVYVTGLSPMFVDSARCARDDFQRFFVWTWLLMAVLLYVAFRTLRGVLLPLAVTGLAVFWTLGAMALAGQAVTSVGAMLPTLIAIVCFSDAIHVMGHYYEQAQQGTDRRGVVLDTMEHMLVACLLTSVTTAVAFGSLVVAKLSTIRQFGLWAALGILLGYVLGMVLMPIVLSWLPLPAAGVRRRYEHSLCAFLLDRVAAVSHAGGRAVPVTTLALLVLAILGATRLRIETSLTAFLPHSSPAMRGLAIAREKLTGFGSVEVVLQGPPGCFREPWALRELLEVEQYIESRPEVGMALTITDLLQWTHRTLEESSGNLLEDRHAKGLVAEYLFLYAQSGHGDTLSSLITDDRASARIGARLRVAGSGEQLAFIEDLGTFVATRLDPRLRCSVTGEADRIAQQIVWVLRSLTDSFLSTLVVIALLMLWLLRSLKGVLVAMVPNILPVLWTLGVMGGLDISLNFGTVMITSIAIGIAVDDTIHFLVRYRRELRAGAGCDDAIRQTLLRSGRAMAFTSVTMAAGCALFVLSEFGPNRSFGLLMAFTMCSALAADLLVLPYLIKTWKPGFPGAAPTGPRSRPRPVGQRA